MSQSLAEFCLLTSVCEAWQWSRMHNSRRVGKNGGLLVNRFWAKVHDVSRRCRRLLVVFDFLFRLFISCWRYSLLSLEYIEKTTKSMFLAPNFWRSTTPTFYGNLLARFTVYKVWLSFVCWSPSAKPGNKVESRIYGRWVKPRSNFKPFVDQRSTIYILRRPFVVSNTPDYVAYIMTSVPKVGPI